MFKGKERQMRIGERGKRKRQRLNVMLLVRNTPYPEDDLPILACIINITVITPVRILLSQNQMTVKSKRGYLATCSFLHQLELKKIFILLMNFA